MSAWKLIIEDGNTFRWESAELKPDCDADTKRFPIPSSNLRLPSMTDLLIQGCSKITENHDGGVKGFPMFRTGLGRSVAVKQSSIAKALSLLGESANAAGDEGLGEARENVVCFSNSLFRTGSGKSVNISTKGLIRAKALLGKEKDNVHSDFNKLKDTRKSQVTENCDPLSNDFKKNDSVDILKDNSSLGLLQPGIGDTTIRDPPIMFQTAGGRSISVSNDALKRARSLLGNPELGAFLNQGVQNVGLSSCTNYEESEFASCNGESEANCLRKGSNPSTSQPEIGNTTFKNPPIMFRTAGGSSISISNDSLKRARSLLGDPELGPLLDEGVQNGVLSTYTDNEDTKLNLCNRGSEPSTPFSYQQMTTNNQKTKSFTSPFYSSSNPLMLPPKPVKMDKGTNLMKKFNAVGSENGCRVNGISRQQNETEHYNSFPESLLDSSLSNGTVSRISALGRSCGRPLVDISNTVSVARENNRQAAGQKRQLGRANSISPFKRPRISKFRTPFKHDTTVFHNGLSSSTAESSICKISIFSQYPFSTPRKYVREFFTNFPQEHKMLNYVSDEVRWIRPDNAEGYIFSSGSGSNGIGAYAFFHMLLRCGASTNFTSIEWVRNHYKWIVWKLASYERCNRSRFSSCFLTVSNVLQELKYRYEREVKHGHRSAIKKILEGDASSSRMMVLCIADIHLNEKSNIVSLSGGGIDPVKVELTDGWYSITSVLDDPLAKQLSTKRLFVGQKLRIWGARLCGWAGPASPLEVSTNVSLVLHMNGTYRAHWAERLGFCKCVGPPLAFKCIKHNGGLVPQTIAGVTRIYPLLYRERLANGHFIVRPERMENHALHLHNQRRSSVVEDIICEFQMDSKDSTVYNDCQSEGAKIFKILETAAEPDVLMADMSVEQLNTFAAYQAKLQAVRKARMEKSIEEALNVNGLQEREVTPFMRVRVVGLTRKCYQAEHRTKEGIITIWNPTEKQQCELVEGQAYVISGLTPSGLDSDTLQLQTRGSSAKWQPLSHKAINQFKPFFNCRESASLSSLGDIPLSSEFDVAAFVVHVGGAYAAASQKKQWVFVTDGSMSESDELTDSLLAISFSTPLTDDDSFVPFNYNLAGSTVGFFNLIKRAKDCTNRVWVADATDNSTFSLTFDSPHCSHLRNAAKSTNDWANISSSMIDKIRDKVLFIIGR